MNWSKDREVSVEVGLGEIWEKKNTMQTNAKLITKLNETKTGRYLENPSHNFDTGPLCWKVSAIIIEWHQAKQSQFHHMPPDGTEEHKGITSDPVFGFYLSIVRQWTLIC